jgi:hypothetical protein
MFMIDLELVEECSVGRDPPTLQISQCSTWSMEPKTGIVSKEHMARARVSVMGALDLFVNDYQRQNGKDSKGEDTLP